MGLIMLVVDEFYNEAYSTLADLRVVWVVVTLGAFFCPLVHMSRSQYLSTPPSAPFGSGRGGGAWIPVLGHPADGPLVLPSR